MDAHGDVCATQCPKCAYVRTCLSSQFAIGVTSEVYLVLRVYAYAVVRTYVPHCALHSLE